MRSESTCLIVCVLALFSLLLTGCPRGVDEKIRESTDMRLSDLTQARDRALDVAVEENIRSDLELRWYADTYGLAVEMSHTVATVYMKVKTEEQKERALRLARQAERITEVIDEIEVDPTIEGAPFEW